MHTCPLKLPRMDLPVEPVICVAWKWKWVVAAEVVAGVGILKGPNGRAYKNNTIRTEKQKERRKRREAVTQRKPLSMLAIMLQV